MNDEISEYIDEEVYQYKKDTNEFLDKLKTAVFTGLITGIAYKEFSKKVDKLFGIYNKGIKKIENNGFKEVKEITYKLNDIKDIFKGNEPIIQVLNNLFKKIDMSDTDKAKNKLYQTTKDYYKKTEKTLSKEWVNKEAYLSKKLTQYDKVEKVVPYYRKDGIAYYDISSYNSMVYNTNLTKSSWNASFERAKELKQDLVKMSSHPFACDLCREHQGKIYSLTGATKGYERLDDVASPDGTMHPNCKHSLLLGDLVQDDKYSGEEWHDRYEAKQKKQSLELQRSRLRSDKEIYKKLNNQEEVDKLNKKISKLNKEISIQKEKMNG